MIMMMKKIKKCLQVSAEKFKIEEYKICLDESEYQK